MKSRGNSMNLRSTTVVRQGKAKGENFQHVLRKRVSATSADGAEGGSSSPTGTPRKRAASTTPTKKKFRPDVDQSKSGGSKVRSERSVSVDNEEQSEAASESGSWDMSDATDFFYAKPLDNIGLFYDVDGYQYRRNKILPTKIIALHCAEALTNVRCKMRARLFIQGYEGKLKIPSVPADDHRIVGLHSTKNDHHNHPPPARPGTDIESADGGLKKKGGRPKKTPEGKKKLDESKKTGDGDEEEEEIWAIETMGDSDSEESDEKPSMSETRGSRHTKQKASAAWEWLKTRDRRQFAGEKKKTKTDQEKGDGSGQSSSPTTKLKLTSMESGKRSMTLLQKLRKNAVLRYQAAKRHQPVSAGDSPKKSREETPSDEMEDDEDNGISSGSPSVGESGTDEAGYTNKVTIHDGKYYIMDGFAYLKERDRKGGGYNLRCVDRLNCRARAIAIWKEMENSANRGLFGRHTNAAHSHDRFAPGHGVEMEEPQPTEPAEYETIATTTNYGQDKENSTASTVVSRRRRRNSFIPITINLEQMVANYRHILRTLVELQDGANVEKYAALVRLVEATGEQLIEYLTDEDMSGCGDEENNDCGVDQVTITLLNQQFKQYRALYDLFILNSDEFQRFVDGYARWLTTDTAELWWNNGNMLEFLSRKILRNEKYRDNYTAALIKSQGSTRLRVMDRPLLPLPEPEFLRSPSDSIRQEEMRESLHEIKAMIEALRSSVEDSGESTVDLLLTEFDEAADTFIRFYRQGETRVAAEPISGDFPHHTKVDADNSLLKDAYSVETWSSMGDHPFLFKGTDFGGSGKDNQLKPSKSILRGMYFKYIYCISRMYKLQEDSGFKLNAQEIASQYIDDRNAPDSKCRSYYRSLREYRAICDFMTLAPAHAVNILTWFQKWRVPANAQETWKNSCVFDLVCRRMLTSFRYKDLYAKATNEILANTDASSLRRLPLLPFGVPRFLSMKGKKSVQSRRMRSLALSRQIIAMRHMGEKVEIKSQKILREIDDAADAFFKYLRSNEAWPISASLKLYLSSENNNTLEKDGTEMWDLLDRLHQELSQLDSLCVNRGEERANKARPSRPLGKGPGKPRNGRKVTGKRGAQSKRAPMSPRRLLSKMEENLEHIDAAFADLDSLGVCSLEPSEVSTSKSDQMKTSDTGKSVNPHQQRMQMILSDLCHLEAVMTLEDLGRAVEHGQFEHRSLGLVLIRNCQVVRCGGLKLEGIAGSPEFATRRVTLALGDLPKCLPWGKIDYDSEDRALLVNGVPVDLQCPKYS